MFVDMIDRAYASRTMRKIVVSKYSGSFSPKLVKAAEAMLNSKGMKLEAKISHHDEKEVLPDHWSNILGTAFEKSYKKPREKKKNIKQKREYVMMKWECMK